jgi:hypothetical protein
MASRGRWSHDCRPFFRIDRSKRGFMIRAFRSFVMKPIFLLALQAVTLAAADLPLANQSYGELRENLAVAGGPLNIGGKVYQNGLGSHAMSEIPVTVPEGAARFTGACGVDDGQGAGKGSIKFRILSGNAVLWESTELKSGDPAVSFDVPVSSSLHRWIYLQADDLGDNSCDHADWVDLQWKKDGQPVSNKPRVLGGADFGLRPDADEDQSGALRAAIQALRESPGSTLKLVKGTYHFRHSGAIKRHFHISNHDQPKWHPVSIPLVDLRGGTIDGQGSLFLFHGEVLPVLVMDSENITLRGIGIDYAIPHHSQGCLTKVDPEAYEVEVDAAKYPHEVGNGWLVFKGDGWKAGAGKGGIVFDGKTREIVAGTSDYSFGGKLTELSHGHYRVERNLAASGIKAGDVLTFRQGGRPHPAVTLYRAKNTSLIDCPIHSSHGMGLLAQRSENIRVSGGGVFPRKETGRYFSTVADATHYSNCKGVILSENGLYEGMMDDAINVHATCLRIEDKPDARTLRCRYVHGQSIGFETFLPGETLRFIQAKWLTPRDPRKVKAVRKLSETEVLITLGADIPADLGKGDAVENADWFPEVIFRGNTVRHNRARGTLFTTPRRVLVENNIFDTIAGSAILLAGDANGWYESGACHDTLIRGNTFRNNLTSRFQFTEAIISIYPEVPDLAGQKERYHRRVRIEDNTFETFDVPLVFAMSTDGLSFTGNRITYNDRYPAWNKPPFHFRHCENTSVKGNTVTRDGKRVEWTEKDVRSEP